MKHDKLDYVPEGQMTFADYFRELEPIKHKTEVIKHIAEPAKPVCSFSQHECNKEEVWKVTEFSGNTDCQKTCCRQCDQMCGARCNGSENPAPKVQPIVMQKVITFDQFREHCRHNGWHRGEDPEKGIAAAVMCGYQNRRLARCWDDWAECTAENCPLLKGGDI